MEMKANEPIDYLFEIEKYAKSNGLQLRPDDSRFNFFKMVFLYVGDKQYQGGGSDIKEVAQSNLLASQNIP